MTLDDLEYWTLQAIKYTQKYRNELEEEINRC
jgi:hypothetical protein